MGSLHERTGNRALAATRLTVVLAVLGPWLWLFGHALVSAESFVFRDAAHYYYPLFRWTAAQWGDGRVPLWNPQDNLGIPQLADSTSSVFYPGKLIFILPFVYATRYKLFVALHVLLAAFSAFLLARRFRSSTAGAGLAAVSYALSGNVVFQYCNVVFLVGAVWLPLALLAADRMIVTRRPKYALALGAVLAVMTLGGDPQMAYNAGLLAFLYAWLRSRRLRLGVKRLRGAAAKRSWIRKNSTGVSEFLRIQLRNACRQTSIRIILLALAAVSAATLAAVQVLPTWEWSRRSQRAAFQHPRSLFEIPSYLWRGDGMSRTESAANDAAPTEPRDSSSGLYQGLIGRPSAGSHQSNIYEFSVGPWRWPEFVWPNIGGQQFPINRRWINAIPAEGRVWSPTMYMGLLPFVMGLSALHFRAGSVRRQWLSWTWLLSLLASLGMYGIGWLIDEMRFAAYGADAKELELGTHVGGVYWWMTIVLPGYVYFRYPAKLLVITTLATSMLAARGWDRTWRGSARGTRRFLFLLGAASLIAMAAVIACRATLFDLLAHAPADPLFGPLDRAGVCRDIQWSLAHTAVTSGLLWWFFRYAGQTVHTKWAVASLILTAAELALAQSWLVPCAPVSTCSNRPQVERAILKREKEEGRAQPFRVFRASPYDWTPAGWNQISSKTRQIDGLAWDHDTLLPKYHLASGLSLAEATGTILALDYQVFLDVSRRHGSLQPNGTRLPSRSVLDALGVHYFILPAAQSVPGTMAIDSGESGGAWPADTGLWHNPSGFSRAWIVHDVQQLTELETDDPEIIRTRTKNVLFPDGSPRDLRSTAVVETDDDYGEVLAGPADTSVVRDAWHVLEDETDRVELKVELARPGLVVLSDYYDSGWRATAWRDGSNLQFEPPVLRTNRVMRGVFLPAGKHHLLFRYRPRSFFLGACTSALGWAALAAIIGWRRFSGRAAQI